MLSDLNGLRHLIITCSLLLSVILNGMNVILKYFLWYKHQIAFKWIKKSRKVDDEDTYPLTSNAIFSRSLPQQFPPPTLLPIRRFNMVHFCQDIHNRQLIASTPGSFMWLSLLYRKLIHVLMLYVHHKVSSHNIVHNIDVMVQMNDGWQTWDLTPLAYFTYID